MEDRPRLLVIAGPNGSGKSTLASRVLPRLAPPIPFINPDDIARSLNLPSPMAAAVAAGKKALLRMMRMLDAGHSFAIETTFSGQTHLRLIETARSRDWYVEIVFIFLLSPAQSRVRVDHRVSRGGHDVPTSDLNRRFGRSLANFESVRHLCDLWSLFDNSGSVPIAVAWGRPDNLEVLDDERYARYLEIRGTFAD